MKYKVYVAEDEPPLLRNIVKKIQQLDEDCEVVGQAFNGEDALADIVRLQPDILITDIRMPITDGLSLVKSIRNNGMNTVCLILSGYQEFEYAKQAIQLGVEDYLIKPLTTEEFVQVFNKIKKKIDEQRYNKGYQTLNKIVNLDSDVSGNLEGDTYGIMYMCINNPLSDFQCSKEYIDRINYLIKKIDIERTIMDITSDMRNNCWILDGKLLNEKILICGMGNTDVKILPDIARSIIGKIHDGEDYITIAAYNFAVGKDQLAKVSRELQHAVKEAAIVGKSQIIPETVKSEPNLGLVIVYSDFEKKLIYFCQNGQKKLLISEIRKKFGEWLKEPITKRILEINLKHIMRICYQNCGVILKNNSLHMEDCVDRIFLEHNKLDSVLSEYLSIVEGLFTSSEENVKDDHEEMVGRIVEYLNAKLAEKISLQEIAEVFGITESYFSKLFKKYKKESPIDFLLKIRIEKAKQYITEYPDMMLKDVANITGFSDQYYFSRIFKSITGKSPTEFKES